MNQEDERDFERRLEEHGRKIFEASTEQERKRAERVLHEHMARPGLTDNIEELARTFEIRLKRSFSFPPDTPAEYKEALAPLLERMVAIPPFDRWTAPAWDLVTQHMVQISFAYGVEPLLALLNLKVFELIVPPPEIFEELTADSDDIERARKTRQFVECVEIDVVRCVRLASESFVDALRGRLGTVMDQTLSEIAVTAITELESELNTVGERHAPH
ncbi:MAG: hypothetical protein ACREAM_12950, partial [Blastocatellia bacterium]